MPYTDHTVASRPNGSMSCRPSTAGANRLSVPIDEHAHEFEARS